MQEIVPDVLVWSRFSERHGYDFNSHLVVRHPDGNLCIDPVEPGDGTLDEPSRVWRASGAVGGRGLTRSGYLVMPWIASCRSFRLPGKYVEKAVEEQERGRSRQAGDA